MSNCGTCAHSTLPDGWETSCGNGCKSWSCDYINIDDAVKAYEDYEKGVLEEVVHCPDCRECSEKGSYAGFGGGYLYCRSRCMVVTETDYCSWGERR